MKFSYTALSGENQKLIGVLTADSLAAAQEELHKMGLSIIAINEISEEAYEKQKREREEVEKKEGIVTYAFLAKDMNKKEVAGTIDAKEDYLAFKRLVTEYHFDVSEFYPIDADEAVKGKFRGKIAEFQQKLRGEGIEPTAFKPKAKGELEESETEVDKAVVAEIDKFIVNTRKVLQEHKNLFSPPFFLQIEKTLGDLERIRTSNNLKHISEICNQLYELVSHPDLLNEDKEVEDPSYQNIVSTLGDSSLVKKEFQLYSKALGLSKIRSLFNKILLKLRIIKEPLKIIVPAPKTGAEGWLKKFIKGGKAPKGLKAVAAPGAAPTLKAILSKLFSYLIAPNPILRQTRRQELITSWKAWKAWKESREKPKAAPSKKAPKKEEGKLEAELMEEVEEPQAKKHDFTLFFQEVDSFLGWLLFFYILYFFLVDFSLEKGFGLPSDFAIKTLKSPLILNITIFLVFAHMLLRLKDHHFRRNILGSLFLFFFGFGVYVLLILNF